MKGVSMVRVTYQARAYCLGTDGGPDHGPCMFARKAGPFTMTAAQLRTEAQRHVQRTGHTVLVDVLDRTDYSPERAAAAAGEPS